MSLYKLKFTKKSKKSFDKLDKSIKIQFQRKLKERLENPILLSAKLSGYENIYKIKLRNSGFRLVYEVQESEIVVLVLKVGKREKFYDALEQLIEK